MVVPSDVAVGSNHSADCGLTLGDLRDLRVHPFSVVWSTDAVRIVVKLVSNLVDQRLQHISLWGDSGV